MATRFFICTAVLTVGMCACSQAPHGASLIPPATTALHEQSQTGALIVRVVVHRSHRSPNELSPSVKGITVAVNGPTTFEKTAGLTLGENGCKSKLMDVECALVLRGLTACPSNKPCYTASVHTYDRYAKGKIPPSAHELSALSGLRFSAGSGTTVVPLVLDGIPHAVAFLPDPNSALTGTQASGFGFPKCNAKAQSVTLVGVDADGNFIVGPGAPTLSLTSSDTTQLSVTNDKHGIGFVLHPPVAPNYAYGNNTVRLTATAKPLGAGTGARAKTIANVRYSGDICGVMNEFPVPSSSAIPLGIASGPDGAMWFTESGTGKIGRVSLRGKFKEYTPTSPIAAPGVMVAGPDRALWFTAYQQNVIGRVTTAGVITQMPIPTANSFPWGITVGPDRNLWFVEVTGNNIGRVTTAGVIKEFHIPTLHASPRYIVRGPNDALWFSECQGNRIASITTSGGVTEYSLLPVANSFAYGIAPGPSETVWFTELETNAIAVANAAGTTVAAFPLPETGSAPITVIVGPDGEAWFTEYTGNRIGRITPSGAVTEYPIPTSGAAADLLTVGPDGAIWFAEQFGNKIGRLR